MQNNSTLPPVIFVHGVRTSSKIWQEQQRFLNQLGHETVAVDLPGHGERQNEKFTLSGAKETIDKAVSGFEQKPLLVGLSLGGYSSLAYAADNSEKLRGVLAAACSTEIKGKPIKAYRLLAHKVAVWLNPKTTWQVVTDMLGEVHGHSTRADLKAITIPIWLVNGSKDFLRFGARGHVKANPTSKLFTIKRAGHDVNSHAPDAFNRILLGALS